MNQENYILFDQYLQEELTDPEKKLFEDQLRSDTILATSFEDFKEVNFQLKQKFSMDKERRALRSKLAKISDECREKKDSRVRTLKPWYYSVAASVTILLGVWFVMQNAKPVFEDYNQYENAYFVERGDESATLKAAQDAFNNKKYKEAVVDFELVRHEKPSTEVDLYYGITLMEVNRLEEARAIFEPIRKGTSIYKNKASWNLVLLELKQKEYDACKTILKTIPTDYENYDQVKELLKNLN
ncbi:hypothetical protein FFWV33_02905 [Flavobacterium faecale]|uniref:Tetratricopeptide repeat protein n=1 Tax=Flavobacterium faecale TaxID=1355330 RepID=A0A2S1LA14_9FLAO|nr:hypothetical protein [Flavobacterium faecale]AWG20554.1 hypothetical protein FFWV33_02905 [Flavobacterium faecale]